MRAHRPVVLSVHGIAPCAGRQMEHAGTHIVAHLCRGQARSALIEYSHDVAAYNAAQLRIRRRQVRDLPTLVFRSAAMHAEIELVVKPRGSVSI